ncbi:hypothetical protein [Hyalangium sp.]|uniref:hypothetical protein n=1 Tax=Hyalangium sp. TaxID=2028555 RepID=UPI002D337D3D|nr:hypothetical protein [Hyalangium sp.]HYI01557.1 hypothetical protein [Hyalangium sp.]
MHASTTNIGALIQTVGASNAIQGYPPVALAAGTDHGDAITLDSAKSCTLTGMTGAATGSPTSYSVAYSLESSATDNFASATAVADSTITLTADEKADEVDVDLTALPDGHLYLRVKVVVTASGGTSPKALVGASVALGGKGTLPI